MPHFFGAGSEIKAIVKVVQGHSRSAVRKACAMVLEKVLIRDAGAQGRALSAGAGWQAQDWLVLCPSIEVGRAEQEICSQLQVADERPGSPRSVRLPEGIEERMLLEAIAKRPEPSKCFGVKIETELLNGLRARDEAKQKSIETIPIRPSKKEPKKKEIELWCEDAMSMRTLETDRPVHGAKVFGKVWRLGRVARPIDEHQTTVDPHFLSCKQLGTLLPPRAKKSLHDDEYEIEVPGLIIEAQESEFVVVVTQSRLDEWGTKSIDEALRSACEAVRLPWYRCEDSEFAVWRVPYFEGRFVPQQQAAHRVASLGIKLLMAAANRPAFVTRALFLAFVTEINAALLGKYTPAPHQKMQCNASQEDEEDHSLLTASAAPLTDNDRHTLVQVRDGLVLSLKHLAAAGLANTGIVKTKNKFLVTKPGDALRRLENTRRNTVLTLLRLAAPGAADNNQQRPYSPSSTHPRSPESKSVDHDEDDALSLFQPPKIVLGVVAKFDTTAPVSPASAQSKRGKTKAISLANALASRDKEITDRKLAARQQSAALSKLRRRVTKSLYLQEENAMWEQHKGY